MELSDSSKQPEEIIMKPSEPCTTSEEAAEGLPATKSSENELQVVSDASCSSPASLAAAGSVRERCDLKLAPAASSDKAADHESGRERLKRHREEMAGRVWIPERWGQEGLLKDWIDSSVFDEPLVPKGLRTAREALVEECRRRTSARPPLRINCSVGRS